MPRNQEPLTLMGHLDLSEHERRVLYATLGAFRAAVLHCEDAGRALGTTANALLHQSCYAALRNTSGLPANLVIRAVAAAARRLKRGATEPPALEYDSRVARLHPSGLIDLSTLSGRLRNLGFVGAPGTPRLPQFSLDLLRLAVAPGTSGLFHAQLTVRARHSESANGHA